jgi:hypothetical protein
MGIVLRTLVVIYEDDEHHGIPLTVDILASSRRLLRSRKLSTVR